MDRSDARARFVPEQLLLSVTAAVASAARRPRSHSWDCSALCIYPLEQLHERWEALVRVEPRSQVQARELAAAISTAERIRPPGDQQTASLGLVHARHAKSRAS